MDKVKSNHSEGFGMESRIKKTYRQRLGKWGEDKALDYLLAQGCTYIDRNVRTPEGEIDILVTKDDALIFVEVKTRRNTSFGYPDEAVTEEKMEHLVNSAEWYLQSHEELSTDWRIDVIAIIGAPNMGEPQVEWFENVS